MPLFWSRARKEGNAAACTASQATTTPTKSTFPLGKLLLRFASESRAVVYRSSQGSACHNVAPVSRGQARRIPAWGAVPCASQTRYVA